MFAFTSTSLIISIIRTILTNPGNIPDHKEWDMSTDNTSAGEETVSMIMDKSPDADQGNGESFTN